MVPLADCYWPMCVERRGMAGRLLPPPNGRCEADRHQGSGGRSSVQVPTFRRAENMKFSDTATAALWLLAFSKYQDLIIQRQSEAEKGSRIQGRLLIM